MYRLIFLSVEFRRNRGKRTEAPDHLCSIGESVMFPAVSGSSLSGQSLSLPPRGSSPSGQSLPPYSLVSLILVSMRGLGMAMCEKYRAPFEREFARKQSVGVYEMSLLDKGVFRLIQGWVERNLRKKIDPQRQSSFLVCSEGVESVKSGLAIGNSIVGYAYLVDKEGRVRWKAHATPNEREIKALIKCTKTLMNDSKNSNNR
ncbi:uncharacterized protein LOC135334040 isoform X2 [Halichondria panicea]|uniref:uncharacterized protein LOC135334040 isoform X2 n=1 Tax=Halichondria panicea TaxID=6063 RepID=UPI00312B9043